MTSAELFSFINAIDTLNASNSNIVLNPAIPTSATANYDGFVVAGTNSVASAGRTIAGRYSMTANFANSTVTGSMGDFAYYVDDPTAPLFVEDIQGTLPLSNGTITGTQMSADANGTLTDSVDSYAVTSSITGEFFDNSGTNLFMGLVLGTTTPNTTGSAETFGGAVVASE